MHVGLGHLDIVQSNNRIELDVARLGGFAHHLAMHLAGGRHVDYNIGLNFRLAGQPAAGRQHMSRGVTLFGLRYRRQTGGTGAHTVLGELAFGHQYLTTPANRTPATHRIDIDAKAARCRQQRRANGETATLARGRKDNEAIEIVHGPDLLG